MPEHNFASYRDLLLFLTTAAVIVPLFGRLKVSPVLGFLLAGVLLGPFALGKLAQDVPWLANFSISNSDRIAPFAEFGMAFLLFMIGLELSWGRLMSMRRLVFGLGSVQVVLSSAALAGAAFLLGQSMAASIVLGSALALSSTALILPALASRKRLGTPVGRGAFAVLLFQDLAVAPLLFLVSLLGAREDMAIGWGLVYALGPAVIAIGFLLIMGRLVLRPLFHLVASTRASEHFVALCLLIVVGTALVTAAAGQSMALGAFVAGLLLAETEYRRVVEVTIQPFQGLLLGLLFVSIGAGLDLSELLADPLPTLAVVAGLMAIKFVVIVPAARAFGMSFPVARELGLVLGPAGEFALVLIGMAVASGAVPGPAGTLAVVAATLSMFAIPILVRASERVSGRGPGDEDQLSAFVPDVHDGPPRVILVGFGRVGELVGQMLTRHGVPYLALDGNPSVVRRARKNGHAIFFGDATNPELLRRCGIATAPAIVVTMDDPDAVEDVVKASREERPDIVIVARARDAKHATELYALQATDAVPENLEASLQLAEAVLVDIGVPMGKVIASIHEKRDEFRNVLKGSRAVRVSARAANPEAPAPAGRQAGDSRSSG